MPLRPPTRPLCTSRRPELSPRSGRQTMRWSRRFRSSPATWRYLRTAPRSMLLNKATRSVSSTSPPTRYPRSPSTGRFPSTASPSATMASSPSPRMKTAMWRMRLIQLRMRSLRRPVIQWRLPPAGHCARSRGSDARVGLGRQSRRKGSPTAPTIVCGNCVVRFRSVMRSCQRTSALERSVKQRVSSEKSPSLTSGRPILWP